LRAQECCDEPEQQGAGWRSHRAEWG